ncbi:hypothetical protein [Geomicrobium sp. JCM 19037]|uniref:hypothetical protein n=1 Tax=Geomicrobium sp. JCM 19037 TaxID=1460634 RepID=UPI0005AB8407|nr:hypothetical protein [Geomicrobium sp. JCM 19037]
MSDSFWKKLRWWVYISTIGGAFLFLYLMNAQPSFMERVFVGNMSMLIIVIVISCMLFILIPLIEIRLSRGVLDGRTVGLTFGVVVALLIFFSVTRL